MFMMLPLVVAAETKTFQQFNCSTPDSTLAMDFHYVNDLLDSSVLDMGRSKRTYGRGNIASTGTKLKQKVHRSTDNEGNKFSYELFQVQTQRTNLSIVRKYLEDLPNQRSLCLYKKQEQLAYWLNLHNIVLIDEIVKKYPIRNLKPLLTGTDSILTKKNIAISGTALSLNDIRNKILMTEYGKNPLIIYGLYQGIIGGPNILKQAFTGKNVYQLLKHNASEFINSNRGTRLNNGDVTYVSSYYQRNADYFPNFQNDLEQHLLKFAEENLREKITHSKLLKPKINNWNITDLYGTIKTYGIGLMTNQAALLDATQGFSVDTRGDEIVGHLSKQQISKLRELMRVRAKNIGSTSVVVTDLESVDEK